VLRRQHRLPRGRRAGDSEIPPQYVNVATVTLESISTLDGTPLTGASFPIALPYVPDSNGKYRVKVPDTLTGAAPATIVEAHVTAVVQGDTGPLVASWRFRFPIRRRLG